MTTNTELNEQETSNLPAEAKTFELACMNAPELQLANNFTTAWQACSFIKLIKEALTDEVMNNIFMPLMNTKLGFLTDRNGKGREPRPLYSIAEVRECIINAVSVGLMPTGNQFNIIAGNMYPTKEGYTALLKKLGVKYLPTIGVVRNPQDKDKAEFDVTMSYEWKDKKGNLKLVCVCKKDAYSSDDALRGKAERKAKKALYEFITGIDIGDADETSAQQIEVSDAATSDRNRIIDGVQQESPLPETTEFEEIIPQAAPVEQQQEQQQEQQPGQQDIPEFMKN